MKPGRVAVELPDVVTSTSAKSTKIGQHWPRNERYKWLISMMVAAGLVDITRVLMSLCIVSISKELDWDKLETGLILSSFFWGYFVTQLPGGLLSDLYGGEVVLTWAVLGFAMFTLGVPLVTYTSVPMLYFAPPILLVIVLRVCLGFSQGVFFPSVASLLGKYLPMSESSFGLSLVCAGGPIGSLIAGSIGSLMVTYLGWRWVFMTFGCFAIIWVLFWKHYFLPKRHSEESQLVLAKKFENKTFHKPSNTIVPWGRLIRQPGVWAIMVVHFCHNCMYLNLSSWLPTYFHENYPDAQNWIFNVVPYLGNLVGKILGGYLADTLIRADFNLTFVRKLFETLGTGGAAFAILLAMYVTEFWQALLCMTLAFGMAGMSTSGSICNIQDLSPMFAGSIGGLVYTVTSIPGILGVYLTGYILHATGSWQVVFQLTAIICSFGSVFYIIFGTTKRIA